MESFLYFISRTSQVLWLLDGSYHHEMVQGPSTELGMHWGLGDVCGETDAHRTFAFVLTLWAEYSLCSIYTYTEPVECGVPAALNRLFDTPLLFILVYSNTLFSFAPLQCLHGADVFIRTDVSAELSRMALNSPSGDRHRLSPLQPIQRVVDFFPAQSTMHLSTSYLVVCWTGQYQWKKSPSGPHCLLLSQVVLTLRVDVGNIIFFIFDLL